MHTLHNESMNAFSRKKEQHYCVLFTLERLLSRSHFANEFLVQRDASRKEKIEVAYMGFC